MLDLASPIFTFDLASPLPRLDKDELLQRRKEAFDKNEVELEALLADLDQLKQDVSSAMCKTVLQLHDAQKESLEQGLHNAQVGEQREAAAKHTIRNFLDLISTAVSGLFSSSPSTPYHSPPASTPKILQDLSLTDVTMESRKYDVEDATQKLLRRQEEDLNELDAILESVHEAFVSLAIAVYTSFTRLSDSQKKEVDKQLVKITTQEEEQERKRLIVQTFLDSVRLAFEPLREL
ncbi:hypothetical protein JCM11251_001048 [Rhodosporidiobolus azoricus]